MPADAGPRLEQFTELIATVISNTEARVQLARLADEQAALRRVATLIVHEASTEVLLAKIAEDAGVIPRGSIAERRPVRVDDYLIAEGDIADHANRHGITAAVGCPILVTGRAWGALVAAHHEPEPFPVDAERRIAQFAELLATAIANADSRDQLAASRAPASHRRRRGAPPRRPRPPRRRPAAARAHDRHAQARAAGSRRTRARRRRWSPRRSSNASRARTSCASSPTGSCPRR